jgi:hypothetical protein
VTLINSIAFTIRMLYKNAALFDAPDQQLCGFAVEYPDRANDALGRLTVFFDTETSHEFRLQFLRYVNRHIERMAFEGSVKRERIYHCTRCSFTISREAVEKSMASGRRRVYCSVCNRVFPIDDLAEQSTIYDKAIDRIDRDAKYEQERQQRLTVLGKIVELKDYHVFLCHNSNDKHEVRALATKLEQWGVLPWLDERAIRPGDLFAADMEKALESIPAIVVIVGPHGAGRWQEMEYYAALQRYVEDRGVRGERTARVIPVLLPGVEEAPELPLFLRMFSYVDLRDGFERRQLQKLVDAILGEPTGLS